MILTRLTLRNFRNFTSLSLELGEGPTLFWGQNGQGKTNILEAIYYLSALRSFRQSSSIQLIRSGAGEFEIGGILNGQGDALSVSHTAEKKRTIRFNGNPAKAVEIAGRLSCVVLYPGDLKLARGRHQDRLRWLDFSVAQVEPAHLTLLGRFNRLLKQRNAALKQAAGPSELKAIDQNFIPAGVELAARRRHHWDRISTRVSEGYAGISTGAESCSVDYHSDAAEGFESRLEDTREAERNAGITLCGPHRDRIEVSLAGLDVTHASSEGQARSVALAFKIAQARFIREQAGHPPILLIDDVWGELDQKRRNGLQRLMSESPQLILTTTDIGREGIRGIAAGAARWKVEAAAIQPG